MCWDLHPSMLGTVECRINPCPGTGFADATFRDPPPLAALDINAAVNRRQKLLYSSRIAIVTLRVTTSRVEPDIVILHLFGSMTIGVETYDLEWLVRDLIHEGERKLIFDLAGVDQIDADAALFLVRCFFAARGSGGELRFAAARPDVVRPFHARPWSFSTNAT